MDSQGLCDNTQTTSSKMILFNSTDVLKDQYLCKQFIYSSLILKCIYNTLMGLPRTCAATM